jgi:hypothetical protein
MSGRQPVIGLNWLLVKPLALVVPACMRGSKRAKKVQGTRDKVGETFKEERTVVREKLVGEMKRAAFGLRRIGLPTKTAVLALTQGYSSDVGETRLLRARGRETA